VSDLALGGICGAVDEALRLLPPSMAGRLARVNLLAIALQESGGRARVQMSLRPGGPPGPARGLWQFELGGGCQGIVRHQVSRDLIRRVMTARGLADLSDPTDRAGLLWQSIRTDDVLGAAAARLLLWTDPGPLPMEPDEGWSKYLRVWRPGRPHPDRWASHWEIAERTVTAWDAWRAR